MATSAVCDGYAGIMVRDNGFRQKVYLRLVKPPLNDNRNFIQIFVSSALLAARLSHRNIVQIHELGRDPNGYFIAMEYVPGKTLRQVLNALRRRGEPPPEWFTLQVVAAICDGLQYAHGFRDERFQPMTVLHHELTPANVLISFRGAVKIQNFCMARARIVGATLTEGTDDLDPAYVAPERILGAAPVDRRSDLFSAGMLLLEMLTGVRPPKDRAMLARLIAPTATQGHSGVDAALRPVLQKALAESPERRFTSAEALGAALRAYQEEQQHTRPPVDVGELVARLFPDERAPIHTPTWGTPAVESVVDRVGLSPDLVDGPETVTFAFKREDGTSFIISGLEGWELDSGSDGDDLFAERPSTQSMPVMEIKRLTKQTQEGD